MRKYFFPYIASTLLLIIIVACNSKNEPVNANPRFHDDPKKFGNGQLSYIDTNAAQYSAIIRKLDSFYNIQTRVGFNGSVLVGYKGKIIYERYFGYSNREELAKIVPTSASQLASTSKTFTAAAIMYLHQNKYINIDEKVQTYLPQFPYPDVTVKMLLCHRSGVPDYIRWVPQYRKDTKSPITNAEVMDMFAKYKPKLESRPNTRFRYCNSNYAILASLIEEVTELNYPDFMKKYIFEPLGMKSTFVYNPYKPSPYGTCISYKYNWNYAGETGSISNLNWKLKRTGTATDTNYSIIPLPTADAKPIDLDKYELFDLAKTAVRDVEYAEQENFYLGITSDSSNADASSTSSAVEW